VRFSSRSNLSSRSEAHRPQLHQLLGGPRVVEAVKNTAARNCHRCTLVGDVSGATRHPRDGRRLRRVTVTDASGGVTPEAHDMAIRACRRRAQPITGLPWPENCKAIGAQETTWSVAQILFDMPGVGPYWRGSWQRGTARLATPGCRRGKGINVAYCALLNRVLLCRVWRWEALCLSTVIDILASIGFPIPTFFCDAFIAVEMRAACLFFNLWTSYVAVMLIVFLIFAGHGPRTIVAIPLPHGSSRPHIRTLRSSADVHLRRFLIRHGHVPTQIGYCYVSGLSHRTARRRLAHRSGRVIR